jgi:hypothetical protein
LLVGCGGPAAESTAPAPPRPDRGVAHAGSARALGRAACRGLTPSEAAVRYRRAARKAGVTLHFAELVVHPSAATRRSPGYPRLVASLYATTVPEAQRVGAAAGCAEELLARPGR